MPSRTYYVPGISCDHCKNAIESEVAPVEGVESVKVDVGTKMVHVDGAAVDEAIRAAIEEAGYEIAPVSA